MSLQFQADHWLPGFNFNVEEWDASGQNEETLAICLTLALARTNKKAAGKRRKPAALSLQCGSRQGREPGGSQ
jgi:hypothetical protein